MFLKDCSGCQVEKSYWGRVVRLDGDERPMRRLLQQSGCKMVVA